MGSANGLAREADVLLAELNRPAPGPADAFLADRLRAVRVENAELRRENAELRNALSLLRLEWERLHASRVWRLVRLVRGVRFWLGRRAAPVGPGGEA